MSVETAKSETAKGLPQLSPHLVCDGAGRAMDFYKEAFAAEEMMRMPGPDGRLMHGAMRIGESMVMLVDENPEYGMKGPKLLGETPVTLHLNVEDVDAFVDRAVKAGAKVVMPIDDMFWGDRYGIVEDPFGHNWSIATHTRDVSEEELREAVNNMGPDEHCGNE